MFTGQLHKYQDVAADAILARGKFLLAADMGTGKLQPVSEPVLTPSGWRAIGELVPGDYVIGQDGNPTRVLGVYPQEDRRVYKVTMNDGSWTFAGAGHLWSVQHARNDTARRPWFWRTKTTEEIASDLSDKFGNLNWRIPMAAPVEYDSVRLTDEPYTMGVVLGDGWFGGNNGHVRVTTDKEILKIIGARNCRPVPGTWQGIVTLRTRVLEGHRSWEKFVPEEYLRGTPAQRLALLQGLMDTDGTPGTTGTEYSTTSPMLRDAVIELAQSLGGVAREGAPRESWYEHKGEKRQGRLSYRLNVKLPGGMVPFRLQRKLDAWVPPSKYQASRIIKSVEYSHEEDSVCIYVDSPDHLYVTRNHIVTHNTVISIAVAEEMLGCGSVSRVLIVVPATLKYQWAMSLAQFTDLPTGVIRLKGKPVRVPRAPACVMVDGRAYQEDGVHHRAAEDRRRQFQAITGETQYVIISYEALLADPRQVRRIKAGLVIADEVTSIKTPSSKRAKQIKKLLDAEYRLGLTGTPIENGRPEELFSIMEWIDEDVLGRWDLYDAAYVDRRSNGMAARYKNLPVLYQRLAPAMMRISRNDPGVREYMPDEEQDEWPVSLEGPIREAYMAMGRDLYAELKQASFAARKFSVASAYGGAPDEKTKIGKIMAVHIAMEMMLDHPDLVIASAMNYQETMGEKGSKYAYLAWQRELLDDVWESPKLGELVRRVGPMVGAGDKVLIFSKYRTMLPLLAEAIGVPSVQYHGQMTSSAKAAAVAQYASPDGPPVFLSSHAGAYGVDMNMANVLINYDNPWQPGRADQINARHVRASSEFASVSVHNMVVTGTIEERILDMQQVKRKVSGAILDGCGADRYGRVANDVTSLTKFLERTIECLDLPEGE